MRNAVSTSCERGSSTVIHGEKRGFVPALIHAVNEVKEVNFRPTKRKVVLVTIKDAHNHFPTKRRAPRIDWQTRVDSAGDCKKRRCWLPPRSVFRTRMICASRSI